MLLSTLETSIFMASTTFCVMPEVSPADCRLDSWLMYASRSWSHDEKRRRAR